MTTQEISATWTRESRTVCGGDVSFLRAGSGPSALVLPRDTGHPPRDEFIDLLTADYSVVYPWLPGFHGGDPEHWEWLDNPRDMAVVLRRLVEALDLEPLTLIGLGFGG